MTVEDSIKGPMHASDEIEVTELGGVIDGVGYAVPGSPRYKVGERILLFLETNARGDWVAKNMVLGKFSFVRAAGDRRLLLREADAIGGWEANGAPHREPARLEELFLQFVREAARGGHPVANYLASDLTGPTTRIEAEATAPISTYLLSETGDSGPLGIRWPGFPTPVVFLSHGKQPGTLNGGVTAAQRGLAAWTDEPNSNVIYRYGGTTSIAHTGFRGGSADRVNTIQFDDPADEIPGTFSPIGGATLAIGGAWFLTSASSTHLFGGERFYTIVEADLVVQNGITGPGLEGLGFDHILAHELGHTLGLRHSDEPPQYGKLSLSAIMNSTLDLASDTVGSNLQTWDREAVAAVYGTSPPSCTPPVIVTQPASVSSKLNQSVTLTAVATGDFLQYQWYVGESGDTRKGLIGSTGKSLSAQPQATTSYWVRVSNHCDPPIDSMTAIVTIECPQFSVRVVSGARQSIISGTTTLLSVAPIDFPANIAYSATWFIGVSGDTTSPVAGQSGFTLKVTPARTTTYWAQLTSSCGAKANSETMTIVVQSCAPPVIAAQPVGGDVVAPYYASMSVIALGSPLLTYQWYVGNAPDTFHPLLVTSNMLLSLPPAGDSSYWVRVRNSCGSADSVTASWHEIATSACERPTIVVQPQSQTVPQGSRVMLKVIAKGTSLFYRWYADGSSPIGSGNAVITEPITAPTQFTVTIFGACGSVESAIATIKPVKTRRRAVGAEP